MDRDGVYVCTTPLKGTTVGITRIVGGADYYNIAELRAYSWVPFDELTSTLSADVMPNDSLVDSVHISLPAPGGPIKLNTLFSTGPAVNCYWKMQLGQTMHVKAVLMIGNYVTKANTQNWYITVGNNSNPILNPTIFSSSIWAREIKVDAWGQVVAIIRTTSNAPL